MLMAKLSLAQIDTVLIEPQGHFYYSNILPYSAYCAEFNKQGEPYLYAAGRELGLVTFDISDPDAPVPVDTISTAAFNGLIPNNIRQFDHYLLTALGRYSGFVQRAGLAILDVEDPAHPVMLDQWDSAAFTQGAAIAITDGEYVYLGGMDEGLIILDIQDPADIQFVSNILPDPNYPELPDIFSYPNARGLWLLSQDTLLIANDAGGLRMINISNKSAPVEIGKYADPDIEAVAQSAYNNIAVYEHYAYVTVDWCGLIVIDVSSADMTTVDWINPWNCMPANWDGADGHTNDIRISNDLLFVSGADSEVLVYALNDPAHPELKGKYGFADDSVAAWGLDMYGDQIAVALINNIILQSPYYSDIGGIQLLQWEKLPADIIAEQPLSLLIYPTLVQHELHIPESEHGVVYITNINGQTVQFTSYDSTIDCTDLRSGMYCVTMQRADGSYAGAARFIKL